MIPIRDPRGRVIAFGGRILGDGEPKYLNRPETPLFDKGRTLYNIDRAAPASRSAKRLIVVEGYMDVIALDQAGIARSVAPLGTASPKPSSSGCGGSRPRPSSASTAMPRARKRRSARPCARSPMSGRSGRCASSPCPLARTPTISSRRAARRARNSDRRPRAPGRATVAARARVEPWSRRGPRVAEAPADGPCRRRSATAGPSPLYRDEWLRAASIHCSAPPLNRSTTNGRPADRSQASTSRLCPHSRADGPGHTHHRQKRRSTARTARAVITGFPNFPERYPLTPTSGILPIAPIRCAARFREFTSSMRFMDRTAL